MRKCAQYVRRLLVAVVLVGCPLMPAETAFAGGPCATESDCDYLCKPDKCSETYCSSACKDSGEGYGKTCQSTCGGEDKVKCTADQCGPWGDCKKQSNGDWCRTCDCPGSDDFHIDCTCNDNPGGDDPLLHGVHQWERFRRAGRGSGIHGELDREGRHGQSYVGLSDLCETQQHFNCWVSDSCPRSEGVLNPTYKTAHDE